MPVDRFVIYDDMSWINRGWINRNRIRVGEEARYFTLPARGASQNRRICEIELADVRIFGRPHPEKWEGSRCPSAVSI